MANELVKAIETSQENLTSRLEMNILGGPEVNERFDQGKRGCFPFEFRDRETGESRGSGFVCRGRSSSAPLCEFCRHYTSVGLCDYEIAGPASCPKCKGTGKRGGAACFDCTGTGIARCNKKICKSCRAHVKGQDVDYCPDHRELAGYPVPANQITGRWLYSVRYGAPCWRCKEQIMVGHVKALYAPDKKKLLCVPCAKVGIESEKVKVVS